LQNKWDTIVGEHGKIVGLTWRTIAAIDDNFALCDTATFYLDMKTAFRGCGSPNFVALGTWQLSVRKFKVLIDALGFAQEPL
jgi:hypothetical protein